MTLGITIATVTIIWLVAWYVGRPLRRWQLQWSQADLAGKRELLETYPRSESSWEDDLEWLTHELRGMEREHQKMLDCQRLGVALEDLPRALKAEKAAGFGIAVSPSDTERDLNDKLAIYHDRQAKARLARLAEDVPEV